MFTTIGYLYNQIHPVVLGTSSPDNRWNRMYYSKPVKLHKGVDNPIKFKIRNNNQKDVDVSTSTFTISIIDSYTNHEKISRTLDIENAESGLIGTTITEEDLDNLDAMRYHYGIRMVDSNGVQYPIYVDDNYSASGVVEVHNDAYPGPVAAVEPVIGSFENSIAYTDLTETTQGINGINTVAYYLTDFTGTITAQGHLENTSSIQDEDYIDVVESSYANQTGVVYVNFVGLFTGVRFKVYSESGTVSKILYKF